MHMFRFLICLTATDTQPGPLFQQHERITREAVELII
jgi:hypothetical protein